jgi:hypothetical protein
MRVFFVLSVWLVCATNAVGFKVIMHEDDVRGGRSDGSNEPSKMTDGSIYTGEWLGEVGEVRHGYGHLLFPNGDIYEGSFKNDMISGEGEFKYMQMEAPSQEGL